MVKKKGDGIRRSGENHFRPAWPCRFEDRDTPSRLDHKGLGFSVVGDGDGDGDGFFGHGGADSTNTSADRKTNLILIWLVRQAGFPGECEKARGVFREAAI